jgi:hypothetical protein
VTQMDDDTVYQIAQHTYAAIIWLLQYIESHDLVFTPDDRPDLLEFHLNRIDALFLETENPAIRRFAKRPPPDKLTEYPLGGPLRNYILQLRRMLDTVWVAADVPKIRDDMIDTLIKAIPVRRICRKMQA